MSDADELERFLEQGASIAGLRLQALDLSRFEAPLLQRSDLRGLVVLGGRLTPALGRHLTAAGAIVFPAVPDAPVDPYRGSLYLPEELYDDLDSGYEGTPDARAYAWSRDARTIHDVYVSALRALHDDAMSDALDEALKGRRVVGVMGGHAVARGSEEYARAARLGRALAGAGLVVLTGGGPGAMEAANLGALTAGLPDDELDRALETLAAVPGFVPSIAEWAVSAFAARSRVLRAHRRLGRVPVTTFGIPTWFYGHEPPNVFSTGIAKYFSNALREDGLLGRCSEGVVVLPGAAGTVQEIFQAMTPRYYGLTQAPLVLVDTEHWTRVVPAWPLVEALRSGGSTSGGVAAERSLGSGTPPRALLVASVEEAASLWDGDGPDAARHDAASELA